MNTILRLSLLLFSLSMSPVVSMYQFAEEDLEEAELEDEGSESEDYSEEDVNSIIGMSVVFPNHSRGNISQVVDAYRCVVRFPTFRTGEDQPEYKEYYCDSKDVIPYVVTSKENNPAIGDYIRFVGNHEKKYYGFIREIKKKPEGTFYIVLAEAKVKIPGKTVKQYKEGEINAEKIEKIIEVPKEVEGYFNHKLTNKNKNLRVAVRMAAGVSPYMAKVVRVYSVSDKYPLVEVEYKDDQFGLQRQLVPESLLVPKLKRETLISE